MFKILIPFFLSSFILAGVSISTTKAETESLEKVSELCDEKVTSACSTLARLTRGRCASPGAIAGCRYDSEVLR